MKSNFYSKMIYSFRRGRGLDRHEFAEAIGKDYVTVTKWEAGSDIPSDQDFYTIAESFGISPEIFGLEPLPESAASKACEPKAKACECEPKEQKTVVSIDMPDCDKCREQIKNEIEAERAETLPAPAPVPAPVPTSAEAKAYEEKKENYEKQVRISSYKAASVKMRRLFAWLIDGIIHTAVFAALAIGIIFLYASFGSREAELFEIVAHLSTIFIAVFGVALPLSFTMRDLIFGGRSLGKRIFGLMVVDEKTGKKCFVWQRLFRNIFTGFELLDGILILVRGKTIGDSVVGTLVVSRSAYRAPVQPELDENGEPIYDLPKPQRKNHTGAILTIVIVLILVIALAIGGVFVLIPKIYDEITKAEEYEIALDYVLESDEFESSGKAVEDVDLVFFLYNNVDGETSVIYIFTNDTDFYVVVLCRVDEGEWMVDRQLTSLS